MFIDGFEYKHYGLLAETYSEENRSFVKRWFGDLFYMPHCPRCKQVLTFHKMDTMISDDTGLFLCRKCFITVNAYFDEAEFKRYHQDRRQKAYEEFYSFVKAYHPEIFQEFRRHEEQAQPIYADEKYRYLIS